MTESGQKFVMAGETEVETVGDGIKRQMLGHGPELMICKVWFDKGAVGEVHSHRHSQSTYVESGKFRVMVGDKVTELAAGDSFYVEPHADHGAVCLEPGVLIDTFSPAREDFLGGGE